MEERIMELENALQRVVDYFDAGDLVPGPDSYQAMTTFIDDLVVTLERDYPDDDTE